MSKGNRGILFSLLSIFLATTPVIARARCKIDVSKYVGWSILYSGTVTGYVDSKGKRKDEFEGCEYGRKLIIDHSKAVTCATYSYSYSYMPDIVILSKGALAVACIDDEMYDIQL